MTIPRKINYLSDRDQITRVLDIFLKILSSEEFRRCIKFNFTNKAKS